MTLSIAHSRTSSKHTPDERARIRATLARAPLFQALPLAAIEDLTERVATKRVPAHRTIVSQDETADSLFLIQSGRIKVGVVGENGREVTLALLRTGETFGEMSLFDGGVRSANCISMEPCTLLELSRDDLLLHLTSHPRTALNMLGQMSKRLRRADETITQLALCDVNERLIWQLVSLAKEDGTPAPEGILVRRRPTQQELANMIGSCRETISRAFNQLARDGLIIARGRSMIVTPALMAQADRRRAA
ncbi:MAG: Crp/Fnr family transcriptional regulator [Deltaproteobacteria bacterium]|nr:Crp/Fnr family transcriptional regulator [Deltaproteobacteria bacterium]